MIRWPAPAKLNLFLHITGRRADGYHLLQTVFQLLDVGDELAFSPREDGLIRRDYDLPGVSEEVDLVMRAARALQSRSGTRWGAVIHLDKRLPAGGGLGGGSSDAATTLVALNQLWECGLSPQELAELGLTLGADVPVFVEGHSAWAEGVGEQLQAVELPERWFVVLAPAVNVSTAKVFADPQLIRDCPPITIRDFLTGQGQNVCGPVVSAQYPEVAAALTALSRYAPARLTGTGACVFAAFESEPAARNAWAELAGQWQGFVAKGVNTSPLLTTLRQISAG
ncbi:MAG: 4-(cytidine 5'-diphospho)-2-C-methyl-D-erythritol kinase [Gammaproteobacteria bacterium]|jgi:4-diphosphocytidyl-2-C-methyl-D-erythritol kinase